MKKIIVSLISFLVALPVYAAVVQMDAVPTNWKLENYIGDIVIAWYAGSSCVNGGVQFSSSATIGDKNRFWADVLAAKVSGKHIFVRYDNATTNCFIVSFGMEVP